MSGGKIIPILFIIPILAFMWMGCGEDDSEENNGKLELEMEASEDSHVADEESQVTNAEVRVDGEVEGKYAITETPSLTLGEGGHIVGVTFMDKAGNKVHEYGPLIVEIEPKQVVRVLISFPSPPPPLSLRLIVETSRFEILEIFQLVPNPDMNILKLIGGRAATKGVAVMTIEDSDGNKLDEFNGASEFLFDDGILEFIDIDDQGNSNYAGNSSGRFIIYIGTREDGNILFAGTFATHPKDSMRIAINPDGEIAVFENRVNTDGVAKRDHQDIFSEGTLLKGSAFAELKGDVYLIDMVADLIPAL